MEKAPIKKFAVEARKKLKADVTFQLERYGITENGIVEPQTSTDKELVFDLGNGNTQTIKGERYVNQYRNLAAHVRGFYTTDEPKKELEQFIEEIAYTWFNRLIAIRFMEVNRYLPVRVLSSEITGQKLPDLVKAPFSGDLEFTEDEKKRIFELQDANKEDDLFRFLFFKQCNDLSCILPRLFENLEGHNSFSELLITLSFNDPNGVVYRLVNEVDERWFDIHTVDEDGKPIGQVQIIGWMYQYYNTEPKDKVFADLKKNIKISKQNIPAATQLFTPDWIVRYMVENSLGRLWYEGHPDFDKSDWKYYLDEAPQEPQVEQQLKDIRAQYAKMEPEQLKVIDPCMGSGHILCYLINDKMRIVISSFEKWYANQVKYHKVNGPPPGEELCKRSYSILEVAEILKVDSDTVYTLIRQGKLKAETVDFWMRIPKEEFERWYRSQSRHRTTADRERDREIEAQTISIPEMAKLLGVPREKVYWILDCKKYRDCFVIERVADRRRITKASFEAWLLSQSTYQVQPQAEDVPEEPPLKLQSPKSGKYYSFQEIQDFYGISRTALVTWIREEGIPTIDVGRAKRVRKDVFDDVLKSKRKVEGDT